MRRVLGLAAAALLVAGCAGPAALPTPTSNVAAAPSPTATPTPAPTGATFTVNNATTIPVAIAVNGTVLETVAPGSLEDPIKAPVPPRPWTVEARSPSGRVLATMTVAANDYLSSASGRAVIEELACGRLEIWAGAPIAGEPSTPPDPSKRCD